MNWDRVESNWREFTDKVDEQAASAIKVATFGVFDRR